MLKQELEDQGLKNAPDIDAEQYQTLVNSAEGWWMVMRLFKKKQFTTGLLLSINRTFGTSSQEEVSLAGSISTPAVMTIELPPPERTTLNLKGTPAPRRPPSSRLQSCRRPDPRPQSNGEQPPKTLMANPTAKAHGKQREGNMPSSQHSQDEPEKGPISCTQGTKRRRSNSPETSTVADVDNIRGHPSTRPNVQPLEIEAQVVANSSNRRLDRQLARFTNTAHTLKKDEARTVAILLEGLLASKERGTLAKVSQGLVDNMPVRFFIFFAQCC